MRIPILCAKCGNDFSAPESFVGRRVVCPSCGKGVRVADPGNGSGSGARSQGRRSARGGGRGLKFGLTIVGGVALVVLMAIAAEKLPSLSQVNLAALQGQGTPPNSFETNPTPSTQNPSPAAENSEGNPDPPVNSEPPAVSPPSDTQPARTDPPRTRPPKGGPKLNQRPNREMASEEYDTDRGRALFAKVKRVVIVRGGKANKNQDPRGAIWNETVANCRKMLEKLSLEASTGAAGREASVLTITLNLQPSPKGTPGTKEISLSAELTCADSSADSRLMQFAKVWKAEQDLGTISGKSSKTGKLPNSVENQMATFFGKFRGSYNQAVQAAKAAEDAAEAE